MDPSGGADYLREDSGDHPTFITDHRS